MGYRSVLRPDLFKDQNIIVTGAGSGIGRCTAHELASLGANVLLVGRSREKLLTVQAEISEDGGKSDHATCDIRNEEAVKQLVEMLVAKHGVIDALVNNAGGQFPSPLKSISKNGWDAVVSTNLTGGFLVAREVFNQSMSSRGGSIVNIVADMWGGMPGMGHSGAARAGMVNFTQTAAYEWGEAGVRVNAVAPGWIASSGMDTYPDEFKKVLKGLPKAVPLGRLGNEAEISGAICFLLSEAASFISGTTVRIDGAASQGNTAIYPLHSQGISFMEAEGKAFPLNSALQPSKNTKAFNGFHREVKTKLFSDK